MFNFARNAFPNESLMLTVDVKDHNGPPISEGRIAANAVLRMQDRHPVVEERVELVAWDMALRSVEHDMLLDNGIICLNYVPDSPTADRPREPSASTNSAEASTSWPYSSSQRSTGSRP